MNPLDWVRWKVLAVLVAIGAVLYFLGLDPLAHARINGLGSRPTGPRWEIGGVDLGLVLGDLGLSEVLVATPRGRQGGPPAPSGKEPEATETERPGKERLLSARSAEFDLSTGELLRGRFVVDLVEVAAPRMRIAQRPDGSTNIGDLAGEPPEEGPYEREGPRDWLATARKWYERLRKIHEKLPSEREPAEERRAPEAEPEEEIDYHVRRATYPFAGRPGAVVRKIVASDLRIDFEEEGREGSLPPLEKGEIELSGISSRPVLHDEPIELALRGELGGGVVELAAVVDVTRDVPRYGVRFDARGMPAPVVAAFVGESLPVRLLDGTIDVKAAVELDARENLRVQPILGFRGVRIEAKDPAGKIAGIDARSFVRAFNEASSHLGGEALEIADLHISGTLSNPRFRWGGSVERMVADGGKAFAEAQLRKLEGAARGATGKWMENAREKLREELEDEVGGPEGALGGALEKIAPELPPRKDARETLDGLRKGLFGGGAEKETESDEQDGDSGGADP